MLVKALERAGGARVVSLTSLAHVQSPVDFEDMNFRVRPYEKWQAYAQSKTANVLFAVELGRRWKDRGISAHAVMPGGIMTNLQREMSKEEMRALGFINEADEPHPMFKSAEQGAATSVWAAVSLDGRTGLYLEDCAVAAPWSKHRLIAVLPPTRSIRKPPNVFGTSRRIRSGSASNNASAERRRRQLSLFRGADEVRSCWLPVFSSIRARRQSRLPLKR